MQNIMQRHSGLKPLARDHGVGLVCVQSLQRAVRSSRSDRVRLAQEMKSVCSHIILPYLFDEAEILLPLISDEILARKFDEHHAHIRKLAGALDKCQVNTDPGIGLFARISDAIDDYVRWEEHTLFPVLEQTMSDDELESLGHATRQIDNKHKRPTQIMRHASATKMRSV